MRHNEANLHILFKSFISGIELLNASLIAKIQLDMTKDKDFMKNLFRKKSSNFRMGFGTFMPFSQFFVSSQPDCMCHFKL